VRGKIRPGRFPLYDPPIPGVAQPRSREKKWRQFGGYRRRHFPIRAWPAPLARPQSYTLRSISYTHKTQSDHHRHGCIDEMVEKPLFCGLLATMPQPQTNAARRPFFISRIAASLSAASRAVSAPACGTHRRRYASDSATAQSGKEQRRVWWQRSRRCPAQGGWTARRTPNPV